MIVQRRPDRLRVVRQDDHATACEALARALGLSEDVVRAACAHDRGWRAVDEAPVRRAGQIDDFTRWPVEQRPAIWTACVEQALPEGPYVGALVSRHFERFVESASGEESARGAFARQERARQDALLEEAGRDCAALDADYTWVRALDWISLVVCLREPGALPAPGWLTLRVPESELVMRWVGPRHLALDGAPLREAVPLTVRARDLPTDAERSDTALQRAWRAATPQELTFVVSPGEPTR